MKKENFKADITFNMKCSCIAYFIEIEKSSVNSIAAFDHKYMK